MLTLVYALVGGLCLLAWKRWRKLSASLALNRRVNSFLVILYWGLFASLLCTMLLSITVWDYDGSSATQRRILYGLAIGMILQAAVFALVFTPILMYLRGNEREFSKTAVLAEFCFVPPVVMVVGFGLWLFARTGLFVWQ